ncbi:Sensory neuron membrane protein 2 [Carabus blaptoides fortunei]
MGTKITIAAVVVGAIILIVGVIVGWWVIPDIITEEIGQAVELKENTSQYERFQKLPISFNFNVYFFHVKNSVDVLTGAKPIVEEKGPYVYSQSREKKDIVRDDKQRTISYYEYQHYKYNQTLSGDLKETDKITVLNPALNGAIQIFESTLPNLLPMLAKTTKLIFGVDDSVFLDTNVHEFLFGGLKVCDMDKINTETDVALKIQATLICTILFVTPIRNMKYKDKSLIFTFLDHKQNNHDGHYTVNNGMKYREKVALIEKWQDKEYTDFWLGEKSTCNKVSGRDAVIFEPYLTQESILTVFNTDICRKVDLKFSKTIDIRDVTANEYILGKDTFDNPNANNEDDKTDCYCLKVTKGINEENGCLKRGVLDLYTCYNAPIVLSFPHFLWAHEDYATSVEGIASDEEKHKTYAHLEPETGTPLAGSKKVQFNMFVRQVAGVSYLDKITVPRLVPILWLDESVEITDELYAELYDMYISKLPVIDAIRGTLVAVGAFIVVLSVGIHLWQDRRAKRTV